MRFPGWRWNGCRHTWITECWLGHESRSALYSGDVLPVCMRTGDGNDAMGSGSNILYVPTKYGMFDVLRDEYG
jgi:hypothetical protein